MATRLWPRDFFGDGLVRERVTHDGVLKEAEEEETAMSGCSSNVMGSDTIAHTHALEVGLALLHGHLGSFGSANLLFRWAVATLLLLCPTLC